MSAEVIERAPDAVDVTALAIPAAEAEAIALGLQQLQRLSDALYTMIDGDIKAKGILGELVNAADGMCFDCLAEEPNLKLTESAILWSQVGKIREMVHAACYVCDHEPYEDVPDLHSVMLPHALRFVSALRAALHGAPENMEPLRALATAPFAKAPLCGEAAHV